VLLIKQPPYMAGHCRKTIRKTDPFPVRIKVVEGK